MATTKPRAKRPAPFSWANVSLEDQVKVLDMFGDDGHSILNADAIRADSDIPVYVLDAFTTVEKSDRSSVKTMLFTDQGPVDELRGIYCLTVIWSLANYHGIHSSKFGRGSEARELTAGLRDRLAPQAQKEAGE